MKKYLRLNSSYLAYLFGGFILIGSIISATLTTDVRWMNWHFSRLGEGGLFPAQIFNIFMIASALIMFILAINLSNNISQISDISGSVKNRARKIIIRAFSVIAVCLMGVSIFPFDKFPIIHNTFGYSLLIIFLWLCLSTEKILPIYTRRFYNYCDLVMLFTVIFYALFAGFRVISLLSVEFAIFTYLYLWLLQFIKGIVKEIN